MKGKQQNTNYLLRRSSLQKTQIDRPLSSRLQGNTQKWLLWTNMFIHFSKGMQVEIIQLLQ